MAHEHCIAIVDDDESVRDAATNLFRSMGFVAVAFASAEEFLKSDALATTSCLVLDVQMPGMGGLVLLVEKRTNAALSSNLGAALHGNERHMIEQALEDTQGRVSGPAGTAAKLGVPASTLESKIKRFSIDKLRYRSVQREACKGA